MQIRKIRLKNFRQYIDQEITFSTDPEKNITLIIGDGGTGKTTLTQAFTWALYEQVDFQNKILLNFNIAQQMPMKSNNTTKVELYINYRGIDYIISREAKYTKVSPGKVKQIETILKMYKIINGNQSLLSNLETYATIRSILPKDLSRYFFFDGEKIETMSKEIEKGKSDEFAKAVQGLLGLSALQMAMRHTDPKKNSSVFGYYDSKIEESSTHEVKELRNYIEQNTLYSNKLEEEIQESKDQIKYYENEIEKIAVKLESYKSVEEMQKRYNKLKSEIKSAEINKSNKIQSLLTNFQSSNTIVFLSKVLIKETLEELKDKEKIDKGIPDIQDRTINYLIEKRKKCICGTPIVVGSKEYNSLVELKEFIPPKNVGGSINDLVKELQVKTTLTEHYFTNIKTYMEDIRRSYTVIETNNRELEEIDEDMLCHNSEISDLKKKQIEYKSNTISFQNKIYDKKEKIGELTEKINRDTTKRNNLIAKTNNNKIYSIYRDYTDSIYKEIYKSYSKKEENMRKDFETTINDIFLNIYGSGISINIDQNYNIKVNVDEITEGENDLDHSTSQNYSVIFAFIAAIMKMIKENKNISESGSNDELEFYENYPLVMDAPLSAFDKKRIKNICTLLPNIAEQVLVFIKDTDGDIAKEYMKDKIGSTYIIKMNGLLDSIIE